MLMDKLMLNDEKTEFTLCVGYTAILHSSEVRNLGGWFDNQLEMVTQINQTCKAAFFQLFNTRRIRKFLNSDTVQTLANAFQQVDLATVIVFYLDCLILNCKLKLQRVQNTAVRLISNINKFDHITSTLVKLHWLPVRYRINIKILLITFNCSMWALENKTKLK